MNKRSILSSVVMGAGVLISLIAILIYIFPQIYLYSENRNFEKMREKSKLDCDAMPLHCLLEKGNLDEISFYLQSEGPLELKDNWGQSALLWAILKNKGAFISTLLNNGADPNTKDENGMSILYQTIVWEKYEVATLLLKHGADINYLSGNDYSETIMHFCVMNNRLNCVNYLLENGANKYLKDSFGYTVIDRINTHTHISKDIDEALRE